MLKRFVRGAGGQARVYIPDRISEGYGPNAAALLRLRDEGASVVITVDCGTTAYEPLAEAAAAGLDVVVVDHHAAEPQLPEAYALINPNRLDENNDLGHLAAVGVTFLLAVAVNRTLREAGWYQQQGRPAPDLLGLLDLVALGTVCDVVPLRGLNRVFVAQGLKIMARGQNTGLAALAEVTGVDERLSAYHLGFVLGPRVNAGGRVGEANLGARLLSDDDPAAAREIARHLDVLNQERRDLEAAILEQAVAQVEQQHAADCESSGLILAAGEGWHPGVIGIVASRLKDLYDRPTLVIAVDDQGIGKGSGRSVRGIDFGAAVIAARQSGLLINGGGHAMAAGLTVAADAIPELRSFLAERFERAIADSGYAATMELDGILQPGGATSELCTMLESIGPFGVGNAEPRFVLAGVRIGKADVVGDSHLRMFVQGADGRRLKAIAFRAMDGELGPALLAAGQQPVHLAGKLRLDNWAGRGAVQLIVEDAAPA